MPKLWTNTVEEHRHAVRAAALDAAATLIHRSGLTGVSMTRVAEQAGITRATLYKYFPDVEALLAAWHERQVEEHLAALEHIRDEHAGTGRELHAVLEAYALMVHDRRLHDAPHLHRSAQHDHARKHLETFIADLVSAAAGNDPAMSPDDLARYCIHAVGAAASLSSREAVAQLVETTIGGLRSTPKRSPQP